MRSIDWLSGRWFGLVHRHNLVYNACWEDPRIDREALALSPDDTVAVITSAGCNVLDYALAAPRRIDAIDMNPRQNALLELKLAAIQMLDYESFFSLFGKGRLSNCRRRYQQQLRPRLTAAAQAYWDRHIQFFSGRGWRRSFYFHGTAGTFARVVNAYIDRVACIRGVLADCLNAATLELQRSLYEGVLREAFWSPLVRWAIGRDATLSLLGVPRAQRQQVERHYPGGIVKFIEDAIDAVFARLPLADNYFWRVYLTGEYTPTCCPEYLKPDNFQRLKSGLIDRIHVQTSSFTEFLRGAGERISRFVLLDHMDWLCHQPRMLEQEWQAMIDRSAPESRVLWRSGGLRTDFVDRLSVVYRGRNRRIGDLLCPHREWAAALHSRDRVHTYGSFHIADLAV